MDDEGRLRALALAATPGPWRIDEFDDYIVGPTGAKIHWDYEGLGASWGNGADAALIVAAVNALPALLDVVDAARLWATLTDEMATPLPVAVFEPKWQARIEAQAALKAALEVLEARP